jgi:hypothetical protein
MNTPGISKSLIKVMTLAAIIVAERIIAEVLGTGDWSTGLTTGSGCAPVVEPCADRRVAAKNRRLPCTTESPILRIA